MYPEDRVLVGVINRKKDFDHARYNHWYRIPHGRAIKGIHAEYLAFYFSRAFKTQNSAVHYYARRTGHELVRRRDLLTDELKHPRANALYYKIQLGELREKVPPILNPTKRPVIFVYTTWDRFMAAEAINDLYSKADYFVDRVFFALRNAGIPSDRYWEATSVSDDGGAQLRIACQDGEIIATTAEPDADRLHLQANHGPEAIQQVVDEVRARVNKLGGVLIAPIPLE
jgi:hypothetical protein